MKKILGHIRRINIGVSERSDGDLDVLIYGKDVALIMTMTFYLYRNNALPHNHTKTKTTCLGFTLLFSNSKILFV